MTKKLTSKELNKKIVKFNELLKQKCGKEYEIETPNKEEVRTKEIKQALNGIKRAKGNSNSMLVLNAYRLANINHSISCPICKTSNSKIEMVELVKKTPLRAYFDCKSCGMGFFHADISGKT